jgi:hypothetical protein
MALIPSSLMLIAGLRRRCLLVREGIRAGINRICLHKACLSSSSLPGSNHISRQHIPLLSPCADCSSLTVQSFIPSDQPFNPSIVFESQPLQSHSLIACVVSRLRDRINHASHNTVVEATNSCRDRVALSLVLTLPLLKPKNSHRQAMHRSLCMPV